MIKALKKQKAKLCEKTWIKIFAGNRKRYVSHLFCKWAVKSVQRE